MWPTHPSPFLRGGSTSPSSWTTPAAPPSPCSAGRSSAPSPSACERHGCTDGAGSRPARGPGQHRQRLLAGGGPRLHPGGPGRNSGSGRYPGVGAPRGTCSPLCLAVGLGPLLAYRGARLQPCHFHLSIRVCGAPGEPKRCGQVRFDFGCSLSPNPQGSPVPASPSPSCAIGFPRTAGPSSPGHQTAAGRGLRGGQVTLGPASSSFCLYCVPVTWPDPPEDLVFRRGCLPLSADLVHSQGPSHPPEAESPLGATFPMEPDHLWALPAQPPSHPAGEQSQQPPVPSRSPAGADWPWGPSNVCPTRGEAGSELRGGRGGRAEEKPVSRGLGAIAAGTGPGARDTPRGARLSAYIQRTPPKEQDRPEHGVPLVPPPLPTRWAPVNPATTAHPGGPETWGRGAKATPSPYPPAASARLPQEPEVSPPTEWYIPLPARRPPELQPPQHRAPGSQARFSVGPAPALPGSARRLCPASPRCVIRAGVATDTLEKSAFTLERAAELSPQPKGRRARSPMCLAGWNLFV